MFVEITDYELVVRRILNSDSEFKRELITDWSNGRLKCLQFKKGNVPIGWCLYFKTIDNFIFVSYFVSLRGQLKELKQPLENYALYMGAKGIRFQTVRNGETWERAWEGFKTKRTILEKEF